jgi:3-methyladenine DNA glycosylase AlkD
LEHQKVEAILSELRSLGSEKNRAGMARYAINVQKAFGVPNSALKPLARRLGKDHELALALWASGWREARILAAYVDEKKKVTKEQALQWAADFDSWEVVDHAVKLFVDAGLFHDLFQGFAADEDEFRKRAAFSMLATAAVHLKKEPDETFLALLPSITAAANDERNFVKKAVNWALRQIGKRSLEMHSPALALAQELALSESKAARWIGKDAAKELTDPKIVMMIGEKKTPENRRAKAAQAALSFSKIM